MASFEPRGYAAAFLLIALVLLSLLCRWLAARVRRPAAVWGAGAYLALVHLVCLAGLLTSSNFDSGLAPLTLLTFPFSITVANDHYLPGFDTLPALTSNYVRYVLYFGGLNTLLIGAFLLLVVPTRGRHVARGPVL